MLGREEPKLDVREVFFEDSRWKSLPSFVSVLRFKLRESAFFPVPQCDGNAMLIALAPRGRLREAKLVELVFANPR